MEYALALVVILVAIGSFPLVTIALRRLRRSRSEPGPNPQPEICDSKGDAVSRPGNEILQPQREGIEGGEAGLEQACALPTEPAAPAEPSPARIAAESALARGRDLVGEGRLEEAAALFRQSTKLDPALGSAWYELGLVHARQGKLGKAITELTEAARLDPSLDIRRDLEELRAIRKYRRILTRRPHDAEAHLQLGLLYFARDMGDEALAEFQEAARLKPELAEAHIYMGLEYHYRGELSRAEAEYEEAIRLDPDNTVARTQLALLRSDPTEMLGELQGSQDMATGGAYSPVRRRPAPERDRLLGEGAKHEV